MIRLLRHSDIPAAMRLKEAAGWNQTEEDWANLLELEPEGCFGIECDGAAAATATAVCYGKELAWIGMVLTAPEHRGRGFARRLMEHTLEFLRRREVAWVKLDATDMGRPLYARLGFVDECLVERWAVQTPLAAKAAPASPSHWNPDAALDREAFGADRTAILERLSRWEAVSLPGGDCAMGRPGTKAFYFGPCVARSKQAARRLLGAFLARHPGKSVFWDLLPGNREALALAQEFGFERRRQLVRMALRGTAGAGLFYHDDGLVYGIAGFEYG